MTQPSPRLTIAEALRSPEFREALPRIYAYAARLVARAGAARVDAIPGESEANAVLNRAVVTCLEGTRTWKPGISFETFVCGVIWSQVSHGRREALSSPEVPMDDAAEQIAPSSRRGAQGRASRILARLDACLENEPEVAALCAVIDDGAEKRAQQVAALGWTPERVKAVRAQLKRRLTAAGLEEDDDDDGPGRDGGPREAPTPRRRAGRGRAPQ